MSEVTLTIEEDTLVVTGPLTVKTVTHLFEQTLKFQPGTQKFDLQSVSEIDSAGLALLVHWMNEAEKSESSPAYLNAPKKLKDLAALCSLESLIS